MTTWRKVGCCLATVAGLSFGAFGATYYVKPTATGSGDGSSWDNAMDWVKAYGAMADSTADCEFWLAGDVTIPDATVTAVTKTFQVGVNVTVRGGFRGDETELSQRDTDSISMISGGIRTGLTGNDAVFNGDGLYNIMDVTLPAGCTLSFERIRFDHAKQKAIVKSGAGNISLTDCRLSCNGWGIGHNTSIATGCGLYAAGAGTVSVVNTLVDGNGPIHYDQNRYGGWGIYVTGSSQVTIDNCNFVTNGIWLANKGNGWHENPKGVALYVVDSPIVLSNSRFAGNVSKPGRANNKAGGTFFLEGACNGSRIENCTFIGNLDLAGGQASGTIGGICFVSMKNATDTLTVSGSTFAYNNTQSTGYGAGGLTVYKGAVTVTGSTFYRNFLGCADARGWGSDISILADATLDISSSTLESLGPSSITSVNPANLTMDVATMKTDDPMLTTSVLDAESLIIWGTTSLYVENASKINAKYEATYFALAAFDATPISPRPEKPDIGEGNVLYVKADATGTGDGSSWADAFTTLDAALAVASAKKNEIWIAGNLTAAENGVAVRLDHSLTIRGGFAGTESAAADRTAGAKTTIDGVKTYDLVSLSVKADAEIAFEDVVFAKAKNRAIRKTGLGSLSFRRCDFLGNGRDVNNAYGRGVYAVSEGGYGRLTVTNCVFGGQMGLQSENTEHGGAIYLTNHERFTVDDSLFLTNGMPKINRSARAGNMYGSAIYDYGTPATVRRTRFSGNCCTLKAATGNGGAFYLEGPLGTTAFTNCAFTANYESRLDNNANTTGGALCLNGSSTDTIDIQSCTFAGNVSQGERTASALTIRNGTATVKNCIFWKNPHGCVASTTYGCEIEVAGGATTVSHSIVTSKALEFCHGATLDEKTVTTDEPSFVTSTEFLDGLYVNSSGYLNPASTWTYASAAGVDVHLLSPEQYFLNDGSVGPATNVLSVAVDKGDPTSDFSKEPGRNGNRINLGAYGNTPQASQTPGGTPKADSFVVSYPDDETRPLATLVLGLKDGTGYSASVTLTCYDTNGVLVATKTFEGVPNGSVVEWKVPKVFEPDETGIKVTYSIAVVDAESAQGEDFSSTVGKHKPAYADKGGDPTKVIHVRAGADYKMDGTSWTDAFPDLKSAFDAVTADTEEIWVTEGVPAAELVLTLTTPLSVCGGFAGTENASEERTAGSRTSFDYGNATPAWTFDNSAALRIDRFVFAKCKTRALKKSGAGDLTLADCRVSCCGRNENVVSGRALYVDTATGATVSLTNCLFDGNLVTTYNRGESAQYGGAVYASGCARLVVDDTLFASNGTQVLDMAGAYNYYRSFHASAIYASATPVTIRRSRFVGNCVGSHDGGGTVVLNGNCGASAFTNCAFTANFERMSSHNAFSGNDTGALALSVSSGCPVDIKNCSFAYNTVAGQGAGGLTVNNGVVTVRDSIFWKNFRNYKMDSGFGTDIDVKAGTVTVAHSSVTSKGADSCHAAASATLALDPETVYTLDPSFVTSYDDFLRYFTVSDAGSASPILPACTFAALESFDLHLLSPQGYVLNDGTVGPATNVYSLAIDKGDPEADCSLEPTPNGRHVNLGAYGNTPEASKTSVGQPSVESFEVVNPNDYARPEAHLVLGIESGTDYAATVTIVCKSNGTEIASYTQENVHNGDEVIWLLPRFVEAGAALVYSYTVEAESAATKEATIDVTAGDKYPDYYGKGGGANVVHVRFGADCTPTGDDWTYAYPDLASALAKVEAVPGKGEVWVSTSNFTFTLTAAFTNTVAIRGGFAGTENAASDRVEGAMTMLDNGGTTTGLVLSNVEGTTCTVERLVFSRSQSRAITKTGNGDFVVRSCRFTKNSAGAASTGHAINVAGGGKATVTFADTVFDANQRQGAYTENGAGGALYIENCRTAVVERCLFVSNGVPFRASRSGDVAHTPGSGLYVTGTKLFCRDSRFAANGGGAYNGGAEDGGALFFSGASGGSVVENCAFVGNYDMSNSGNNGGYLSGAICVNLNSKTAEVTIRNCTVAHNVAAAKYAPGGLQVNQGTVTVQDSVFWGNVHGYIMTDVERVQEGDGSPHDIEVRANGILTLENTLVAATNYPHVKEASAGLITWRGNVVTNANPLFVTEDAPIQAVKTTSGNQIYYTADSAPVLTAINVHLRGGSGYSDETTGEVVSAYRMPYESGSPAIDKGRKMRKGLLEPHPNGNRVNLGAYGNTPWATMSKGGTLIFVR